MWIREIGTTDSFKVSYPMSVRISPCPPILSGTTMLKPPWSKFMKYTVGLLILLFVLVGCDKPQQPTIVKDSLGHTYKLVESERKLTNGLAQVELWERIEPLDTNHWYTPILSSLKDTNNPPIFQSLMR